MTETQAIIGRLKEATGVTSDGQLANYLGISRQNIGAARKREDVPSGWIYKVAELTGCSMDWLRFGQGSKMRVEYMTAQADHEGRIATTESVYGLQPGGEAGSGNQRQPEQKRPGFGAAVEMLAKIYSSGDNLLINTINANIRAFCEAIDRKDRERHSSQELEHLKERLMRIEKNLQQTPSTTKKRN